MTHSAPAPGSPPATRPRHDGWTIERQLAFIRTLYFTGCVTRAATAAGMSREGAYRLRTRPGFYAFAGAWDLALATRAAEGHTRTAERPGRDRPRRSVTLTKVTKVTDKGGSGRAINLVNLSARSTR